MEGMRDLLKAALCESIRTMKAEDRLAAAWPVACGKALAERGKVLGYADGVVRVGVVDNAWLGQMTLMRAQLASQLERIAGVKVNEIHFELKGVRMK